MAVVKETKANIDASWNHRGDKFCVGAASGHVFIGQFSTANNFWIGQTLSKLSFRQILISMCSWKETIAQS